MLSDILDNLCLSDIASIVGVHVLMTYLTHVLVCELLAAVRAHFGLTNSSVCNPRALGFEVLT